MKKIIYNSSMPKCGSELLQVILHQNPDIYGSPTSPLLEYLYGARNNQGLAEVQSQPQDLMRSAFMSMCRGAMSSYYDAITDRPIVCDKSRGWLFYYNWVKEIYNEKPKMLVMVRDLRQVLASMEKAFRKNRHLPDLDDPQNMRGVTVNQRVDMWLNSKPIGLALMRLFDAMQQGVLADCYIVRYEDLCEDPKATMTAIYKYLELPDFEHDFNNIVKVVEEDDTLYGVYGKHSVSTSIQNRKKDYLDVFDRRLAENIVNANEWYYRAFNY